MDNYYTLSLYDLLIFELGKLCIFVSNVYVSRLIIVLTGVGATLLGISAYDIIKNNTADTVDTSLLVIGLMLLLPLIILILSSLLFCICIYTARIIFLDSKTIEVKPASVSGDTKVLQVRNSPLSVQRVS